MVYMDKKGHLRARIAISGDLWQVGRSDLSARQLMPIHLAEPFMGKYVPGAVPQIPVPFRGVAFQKLEYEIGCEGMEGGPTDERGTARDLLVEDDWVHIRLVVWWETREHFEYEYAECVPVDAFIISLLSDDLCGEKGSTSACADHGDTKLYLLRVRGSRGCHRASRL
jgi:hypothetical protein